MKVKVFSFLLIIVVTLTGTWGSGQELGNAIKVPKVVLISVYDNYMVNRGLKADWGFGSVIKTPKEVLLFDTGGNSKILISNLSNMGIDAKSISKVVISHIHRDHVGGLEGFLEKNSEVTVFIPSSFPSLIKDMIIDKGAELVCNSRARQISKNVYLTSELYGPPMEQSLIVDSKRGLIIVTGCAHPGIVNIVEETKEMFPDEGIYLVLGGFHLSGATDYQLKSIISDFRRLKVGKVAPSHCSGDRCRQIFQQEYGKDFIETGVGKVIEIKGNK
ncbi:MAG TPA: MBL fold metallo-hydrolase [Desulfohalobiaceae bacterium]|nr:MBL fold metallo-hydrolase [Desulfohalobiaceae bacterium]